MLDAIRKRSGSLVVKVLLLFLVLSFGAWGIGDYIQGGTGNHAVATVAERDISQQAYSTELQREMNRLRQMFGTSLNAEMARSIGVHQSVLNRMIRTEIFAAAAQDFGLMVTDEMVLREIQNMDAFRGFSGNFDRDTFQQAINNAGFSEEMFIALMRGNMSRDLLLESFGGGAAVPETLLRSVYGYREETRSADIVVIPDDAFSDVAEPTDTEMSGYHQENSNQFMAPAYRALTYIDLNATDLAKEVAVTDAEVLEAYEAREGEFVIAARRNLVQAIFATADEASAALEMVASGRGFTDVVAELTGASAESLNLGWVHRDDLISGELADAAFSLANGEISSAIESPLGWHVLQIIGAEDETRQTLNDVSDQLRKDVALEKAIDSLFSLANSLEDEMGGGATLEEASKALDLPLIRINDVDARGLNRAGVAVEGLPSADFLRVAYSTPEGSESPLTESDNDSYFMVRVDSVSEPVLRPLDTVRDSVRMAMLAERREAKSEAAVSLIVGDINSGMSLLDALARMTISSGNASDMTIVPVPSFKRDGSGGPEEMPAALSTILFDKSIGQGGYARTTGGISGFAVGLINGIVAADFTADATGTEAVSNELVGGIRADLMDQLAAALRETYPVSVNESALAQPY